MVDMVIFRMLLGRSRGLRKQCVCHIAMNIVTKSGRCSKSVKYSVFVFSDMHIAHIAKRFKLRPIFDMHIAELFRLKPIFDMHIVHIVKRFKLKPIFDMHMTHIIHVPHHIMHTDRNMHIGRNMYNSPLTKPRIGMGSVFGWVF